MHTHDPISDLLTRIRNAQAAKHDVTHVSHSNQKRAILDVMVKEGFIERVEQAGEAPHMELVIHLKYREGAKPYIREVKRVSKPGRRVYAKVKDLPRVYSGLGIAIVSTPSGIMTNKEARRQKLGGEIICTLF